jgi:RNA polymerase sigma-70 factor (ECF subfamily)
VSADDQKLITDCLNGRTTAFGELVRRYQERLFNTVARHLDNEADAYDVVQETFFSAYQSLSSFKGESQFFTWLYRIAHNTAISMKRKQKVVLSIHAGPNGEHGVDPLDESEGNKPGYAIERAEEDRRVQEALSRLSPEHREVLILKDMEDLKYEDIAEMLGVPIGTVRSRLHRARLELKDLLHGDEPLPTTS